MGTPKNTIFNSEVLSMKYGYARVSSNTQNLARQIKLLKENGIKIIFKEKASGADINRPILKKAIQKLTKGDELVVISLERLGRDQDHLTKVMFDIHLKGAKLHILDIPSFEEVQNQNVQKLLKTLMIELKKFTAADELERITERRRQGIELAKKRGIYKGRAIKYGPNSKDEDAKSTYYTIVKMIKANYKIVEITRKTGVSNSVVYRIINELRSN